MSDNLRPDDAPPASPAPPPSAQHPHESALGTPLHKGWIALAVIVLLALLFGGWGLWRVFAPGSGDIHSQLAASERSRRTLATGYGQLQQRVATLGRSDQISRDANRDLQGTLAERDEEIAGLRADVAFYERLVGATAQRRGLTVHTVRMQQQANTAWHFTSTLTQTLNRAAVSAGVVTLSVEGTRGGQLQTLDWAELRQQENAPGVAYSFKYFQQVEGDVFLPAGFTPVRVSVRLVPRSGSAVEESFTWAQASGENGRNETVGD